MNSIKTAPRDGRRILLIRRPRTKGPLIRNLFVIGKWYSKRQHWTIDSRTIYFLHDEQLLGWYDLSEILGNDLVRQEREDL